jgi:hypothetical protein
LRSLHSVQASVILGRTSLVLLATVFPSVVLLVGARTVVRPPR